MNDGWLVPQCVGGLFTRDCDDRGRLAGAGSRLNRESGRDMAEKG